MSEVKSLSDQYTEAKKIVKRYASYNVASRILSDDDSLGYIVRMMLEAENMWDANHPSKMKKNSYFIFFRKEFGGNNI